MEDVTEEENTSRHPQQQLTPRREWDLSVDGRSHHWIKIKGRKGVLDEPCECSKYRQEDGTARH
jgi:hypothetical protein